MLALFDAPEVLSGEVPRVLAPGVVWDEAAEARFVAAVNHMTEKAFMGRGYPVEDAVRSARWAIEADLHRRFIHDRVAEANRTRSGEGKRELVARWRREIGDMRTDELLRILKDPSAKKIVLETWGGD